MIYAMLDSEGVLVGFQKIPATAEDGRSMVTLDQDECDLTPGKYRWDAKRKTFGPIRPPDAELDAMRVIAEGLVAVATGVELPEATKTWIGRVLGVGG